jgi:phosphatidate cytidylyltransferase
MVLMLAIMSLSVWEYYKVMAGVTGKNRVSFFYKYLGLFLGWILFFTAFSPVRNLLIGDNNFFSGIAIAFYYFIIPLFPVFVFMILELFADSKTPFQNIGINIAGFYYLAVPVSMLNFIVFDGAVFNPMPLIGIILLIWANDAFAYLVGTAIGRHKMFPRISPGKTWEGTLGGIAGNFIVAFLIFTVFNLYTLRDWLMIAAIVSIFATLGDLVESMLKRSLKIKDTGTLFPGHGGMLDRFDAFFFAIPFVALYFWFLKNSF